MNPERDYIGNAFMMGESTVAEMRYWAWNAAAELWQRSCLESSHDNAYTIRLGCLAAVADVLSSETNPLRVVNRLMVLLAARSVSSQRYLERYPPKPNREQKQMAYDEVFLRFEEATADLGIQWRTSAPQLLSTLQEGLAADDYAHE